jgi:hypothetical protein
MWHKITALHQSYAFTSISLKGVSSRCLLASAWLIPVLTVIALSQNSAWASAGSFKDGHIHYNQDMWEMLPPDRAIHMLREAGIERALVGSTPTLGTEKLYLQDPQLVVPIMMPYKDYRHRFYWFNDPQLIDYLREQLARVPYVGFGEFHIFGEDMDSEPVAQMIALAQEKQLVLQPHTDLAGMQILLDKAADLQVIWAHGGFDVPVETLRSLLEHYPNLTIDLSFREGLLIDNQQLTEEWREFLNQYSTRFLTGMDTYKTTRWADLQVLAERTKNWLGQLDKTAAENIAHKNFERLFGK